MPQGYITDLDAAGTLTGNELLEIAQLSTTVVVTGTTISAQASDNSFNDSAAQFIAEGFAVSDRVNVIGFTGDVANNILVGAITALTAGKMTIGGTDGDVIVDDAAGESVTITKWVSRRATAQDLADLAGGGGAALEIEEESVSVDASVVKIDFVGSGVTATQTAAGEVEVNIPGGGGGGTGAWNILFRPTNNEPPTTNYATLDLRNSRPCLDFDTATQEAAVFTSVLPADYGGAGITVTVYVAMSTATSGTVGFDVAIERTDASGLDVDSDSFATAQTITATTVPGTSGQVLALSVNIANGADMDSLAAGELFRLRLRRDVANDTAAGDAEVFAVTVREQ